MGNNSGETNLINLLHVFKARLLSRQLTQSPRPFGVHGGTCAQSITIGGTYPCMKNGSFMTTFCQLSGLMKSRSSVRSTYFTDDLHTHSSDRQVQLQ